MNILVLGGNGFIGSHLVDRLLVEGHFVRVFDKNDEHYRKPLQQVDYSLGEFGNRGLLSEALTDIDIVVHLISTTLPKTSNDDPVFDVQSNVIETLFLLEQCVTKKIKKVIFTSSGGTVYGTPQKLPVKEDNQTDPMCSYGICKLTIEKYLSLYKELYGLNYVVIRPSNPFGPRQNPYSIQGAIPVFLGKILKNEPIHIWGAGDIVRDFIYVEDLAEAICRTVICDTASSVFNIGSGEGQSLNQLLGVIRNVVGHEFAVKYSEHRKYDVPQIYLDINKATAELDWKPKTTLEQGIVNTWNFIRTL